MAGLYDGDGCISFDARYNLRCVLQQSSASERPLVIDYIHYRFGGCLFVATLPPPAMTSYGIGIYGTNARELLIMLSNYAIVKRDQALIALSVLDRKMENTIAYEALKASKLKSSYLKRDINEASLTLPYIAGLLDAEGSTGIYQGCAIKASICQRSGVNLLQAINRGYGGTVSPAGTIEWCSTAAVEFLLQIERYLVHKRKQVICVIQALDFTRIHTLKRTADDNEHLARLSAYVKGQKKTA
jgi:hypothetical protein